MKRILAGFDWLLFGAMVLILIFGLIIVSSVTPPLFWQHFLYILLALFFFLIFSQFDYQIFLRLIFPFFIGSLIFLIIPLLFGRITRGSLRWIQIGSLTIQPSELVKPFLILFFASFFSLKENLAFKRILVGIGLLLLPALLIFFQPDLGSSLVLLFSWLGILIGAGLDWRLAVLGGATLLSSPFLFWRFLQDYQQQRVLSFLNPTSDPLGAGYNLIQATVAVGSGQFLGRGLGRGTQSHLRFLPERHTDFIFASLAEELGFLGSAVLIFALVVLLWRILVIAQKSRDQFGFLISLGIFSLIFAQVFINIGINLGILPITGITLPLVSYGGSSLLAISICLGIIQNINSHAKKTPIIEIR